MNNTYFMRYLADKRLSQREFSRISGFSLLSVHRWYNGYGKITPENCLKIKDKFPDFEVSKIRPDIWG